MLNLTKLFHHKSPEAIVEKEKIAELLQTTPQVLRAFEEAYRDNILMNTSMPDNFFDVNAKQAAAVHKRSDVADVNFLHNGKHKISVYQRSQG